MDPTPTPARFGDVTVTNYPYTVSTTEPATPTVPAPTVPEKGGLLLTILFARYKQWMSGKPWYYHLAAVVLAMILGAVVKQYCPVCAPYVPDPLTLAKAPPTPAPETDQGAAPALVATAPQVERLHEGHRFVSESMRRRVINRLEESGYKTAGGDAKPFGHDAAVKQADKLTERVIIEAGRDVGAFGSVGADGGGGLLAFIRSIFQWIAEHPEQVEAWLRILLSLLMFL